LWAAGSPTFEGIGYDIRLRSETVAWIAILPPCVFDEEIPRVLE
jgi:hypothetical protein